MSLLPNPESHPDKTQRPHGTSEKIKNHDNYIKLVVLAILCPVVIF